MVARKPTAGEINLPSRSSLANGVSPGGGPVEDVDCVIVTYNSLEVIDDCLKSLLDSGIEESKIHIVDNSSADGTVSHVADSYPEANVLRSSTNTGFSKANNMGARQGSSSVVLFANPDLVFLPGAVSELVVRG